jgi:hypothetical protein
LEALGLTVGRIKFAVGTIQQDVGVHAAWLTRANFRKIPKTFFHPCAKRGLCMSPVLADCVAKVTEEKL